MKLTVLERIQVSRFFPQKGNYEILRAWEDFKPELNFGEEETRKFDIAAKSLDQDRLIQEISKTFGFNQEGIKKLDEIIEKLGYKNIMKGQQVITFNADASFGYEKEVKIPAKVSSYLAKQLKDLSEKGELDSSLLVLYEKFVL